MFDRTRRVVGKTAKSTFRYAKDDVFNAKEVQGHFQDVKDLARAHLDPRRRSTRRTETFANAVERLQLSPEDIASSYKNHSFRFYLFLFFAGMSLSLGVWAAWRLNWMGLAPALGATLVCAAQMFSASFRCFQIRHQELLPVKEWWRARDEWWPTEYTPPRPRSGRSMTRKER